MALCSHMAWHVITWFTERKKWKKKSNKFTDQWPLTDQMAKWNLYWFPQVAIGNQCALICWLNDCLWERVNIQLVCNFSLCYIKMRVRSLNFNMCSFAFQIHHLLSIQWTVLFFIYFSLFSRALCHLPVTFAHSGVWYLVRQYLFFQFSMNRYIAGNGRKF